MLNLRSSALETLHKSTSKGVKNDFEEVKINKKQLPKPITTEISAFHGKQHDINNHITNNNSPQDGWKYFQDSKKSNVRVIESQKYVDFIPITNYSFHFSIQMKKNTPENPIDTPNFGKTFANKAEVKNKTSKYKRKKLVNLRALNNLLIKIFLHHDIVMEDFRLNNYELCILVEILIRKNSNLSLGR